MLWQTILCATFCISAGEHMQHNLSEAAKLVGVNRTTIWRHIKQGKLSVTKGRDGNPRVETSELLRVYGELQHQEQQPEQQDATPLHLENIELVVRTVVAPLIEEIEQLREQLRRIEFKPQKTESDVPLTSRAEDDPEWPQSPESFADLRKRRELRAKYQAK